jgi:UDP-N-acetylmuramate dehydrogenase
VNPITFQKEISLKSYNTFGFDVIAQQYITIDSASKAIELFKASKGPFFILGGGSNICLTKDLTNPVLHNKIMGIDIVVDHTDYVWVRIGAGVNWHDLVTWAIKHNLGGIENLSLIPGTVGAAPMQNIGAYGVELKDVLVEVEAIDIDTSHQIVLSKDACNLGYRDSIFKNELKGKCFITAVTLQLQKPPHHLNLEYGSIRSHIEHLDGKIDIQAVSQAVIAIRTSKLPDPKIIGNAGSFFKNPIVPNHLLDIIRTSHPDVVYYPNSEKDVKIPAGWLIDKGGWKGTRHNHVGCHKDQALVLVHYGNGNGQEIVDLATQIQEDIYQKFGIMLTPEVNII